MKALEDNSYATPYAMKFNNSPSIYLRVDADNIFRLQIQMDHSLRGDVLDALTNLPDNKCDVRLGEEGGGVHLALNDSLEKLAAREVL